MVSGRPFINAGRAGPWQGSRVSEPKRQPGDGDWLGRSPARTGLGIRENSALLGLENRQKTPHFVRDIRALWRYAVAKITGNFADRSANFAETSGSRARRTGNFAACSPGGAKFRDVRITSMELRHWRHVPTGSMRSDGPLLCCGGPRAVPPLADASPQLMRGALARRAWCAEIWQRPEGRLPAQPVATSPKSVA